MSIMTRAGAPMKIALPCVEEARRRVRDLSFVDRVSAKTNVSISFRTGTWLRRWIAIERLPMDAFGRIRLAISG